MKNLPSVNIFLIQVGITVGYRHLHSYFMCGNVKCSWEFLSIYKFAANLKGKAAVNYFRNFFNLSGLAIIYNNEA